VSERAEALATQFEQANNELISSVESMSDSHWKAMCSAEQWPVGVTAHHVAGGHGPISGFVQAAAAGGPMPPITMEMIDQGNAQHAKDSANCTKAETAALLRQGGQAAVAMVRGLSDDQLDKAASVVGNQMTTEGIIRNILIGHVQQHTASIKQAAG
jgi:hypothetical protein